MVIMDLSKGLAAFIGGVEETIKRGILELPLEERTTVQEQKDLVQLGRDQMKEEFEAERRAPILRLTTIELQEVRRTEIERTRAAILDEIDLAEKYWHEALQHHGLLPVVNKEIIDKIASEMRRVVNKRVDEITY